MKFGQVDDLDAVGISSGPGSYTGLRIGTSSAKGFCYGKDIPLISVNTLEELCHLSPIESGIKIPLIDARRMEVFGAVYSHDNKRIQEDFNLVIDEDSFANIEGEKITLEVELFSLDGKNRFYLKSSKGIEEAEKLGIEIGSALKKQSNNSYKK